MKFKHLFSFYDYIKEFENHIKIGIESGTESIVLTNYFYCNKNRFLFKNQFNSTNYVRQCNIESVFTTPFTDFELTDNIFKKGEESTNSDKVFLSYIQINTEVTSNTNVEREYYYQDKRRQNNEHMEHSYEIQNNQFVPMHIDTYNIIYNQELLKVTQKIMRESIEIDKLSNCSQLNVRIVFHVLHNVIQLVVFKTIKNIPSHAKIARDHQMILDISLSDFERYFEEQFIDNNDKYLSDSILNNNLTIAFSDRKAGTSSYIKHLIEGMQLNRGIKCHKILGYAKHDFESSDTLLDEIAFFNCYLNKMNENFSKKVISKRTFLRRRKLQLNDAFEIGLFATVPLLVSALLGIVSTQMSVGYVKDLSILI